MKYTYIYDSLTYLNKCLNTDYYVFRSKRQSKAARKSLWYIIIEEMDVLQKLAGSTSH